MLNICSAKEMCNFFSMLMQWLQEDFLGYLDQRESSTKNRVDLSASEKRKLLLSSETMEGLRVTGKIMHIMFELHCVLILTVYFFVVTSFVEMAKFLLSNGSPGFFLLSERVSQDPLENFFGQLRACGGRNENPNLHQCLHSTAAIRVQKSMATNPVRGNCSRKRRLYAETPPDIDTTPLPKRKRYTKTI